MKKAMLGFIATAMSLMAITVQAGSIRSIDPCDQYGYVIDSGSMAQPYTAGQTAYFRIRLENMNSRESWETKDSTTKLSNPWRFQYTGIGVDSALEWAITPPKVGVYVSGQLRGATIVPAPPADKGWYTDILCSYTVRPGDLALPMTLANQSGKEMGDGSDAEYYLDTIPRSGAWKLVAYGRKGVSEWDTVTSTNICSFKYGESSFFNSSASAASEMNDWTTDYALKQAGLYLKSVDFTAPEYSVAQGRTEKVTVGIVGGVNTNGNGTVYAMVKDGDAVALAEDSVELVTVPEDPNGNKDVAYQIAKVTIPSGADVDTFSFKVKGVTQGDESTVYLSTTKSFTYGGSKDLVTNFVTAVVKCVAPPPPYIAVTLDGAASKSITSSPNYTDYAAKLTVTLSEAHTSDVTVNVTPSMISNNGTDPLGKYVGMSTYSENGFLEKVTNVTFTAAEMAGGTLSKDLYVYVLGADDQTDGIGKGIIFKAANVAIYNNENVSAILYIKKSTPQILYPTESQSYSGLAGGVSSSFTIKISDDYTNMQSPFTVEWLKTGSGSPQTISNVEVNSDGEATVAIRYNAGDYTTRFRVKNASEVWSDYRTITVQVNPAKQVSAVVEDPDDSGEYNETEEELTVRFQLTEAYDEDSTLYAFLVPMDAASSNLVVCKAFNTGIAIKSGDVESTATAKIQLLDGTDETLPLTYSIVLRTAKTWNAGETIGTYESKDLEIYINNVPPAVVAVNMSGSAPVTQNGGKFAGKASMGLNKIFTLDVEDVEADLTNEVTSVWTFSDPNGNAMPHTVVAPLDEISLTNVFEVAGVYTCTVKLQDKDMSKKKYGEVFTFQVEVLNTPSLSIEFPNSNTFNETDADKGLSYFNIDLSIPATKAIEVEIECTKMGANGVLNISTNRASFRPGQVRQQIIIDELDGTADSASFKGGFSVTAKVITETTNEDGIAYKDVYLPATAKMYVANEAPVIVQPFDTGATNDAPINVEIPLKWKIADVDSDLNENLTISWITSEGDMFETNGTDVAEGVFTTKFKSGGDKTVTLTVMDKDGGTSNITLYYKVAASKQVYVYPMGPYDGGLTALSRKYASAAGIGEGRAWSETGSRETDAFAHTYTYGATIVSAKIRAEGYKSGYSTSEDKWTPITKEGEVWPREGADAYEYNELRDSFFYAWVIASKGGEEEKSNSYTASPLISPVSPKAKSKIRDYQLSLPTKLEGEDKSNPMYLDSFIEAYFAKELYAADNMGDMNADGIPDYFATLYWSMPTGESKTIPEALTGQAIAGSEGGKEDGEGESATASDLANIATYNDDLDFIPVSWTSANPLKPTNCGPGLPFTALREIRGFGTGLNEPTVSDYELTEAETSALYAAYALDKGEAAADYAAATNWATSARWTPESIHPLSGARLNPLNPDTDGDGLGDAWEYYFWYYAKVGAIVGGKWGQLEGRRYDAASPTMSTRISPEEIAATFNPHLVRETEAQWGVDFDNDGLSDLEEFVLGTNPCDWDTDGDGASDLYEVMSGLDPVDSSDGALNPDCDFMARCEYAEDTFTLYTFADGRTFALPTATSSSIVPAEPATTSNFIKVEVAVGAETAVYWTEGKPATYTLNGAEYLAAGVDAFATLDVAGVAYRGEKTVLAAGTPIASVGAAEEPVVDAVLPKGGISWTDPGTLEAASTTKALEVFNYGGDGVTFVPCTTNVSTYVDLPLDQAVVKVQSEAKITLIHDQVYVQYGFDPRVAWNIDKYGFLDNRWRAQDSENAGDMGDAGTPTNTVAFTSADEYLVMQYRAKVHGDEYAALPVAPTVLDLSADTTFPNLPLDFIADQETASDAGANTNAAFVAQFTKYSPVHGADTDEDGIPDGWELYVTSNPNFDDAGRYLDEDKLNLAQEYAGVDSCNAYTNRFNAKGELIYPEVYSITVNHPGKNGGWWNKFFPTNPLEKDTDGDGLQDHEERDSHSGSLPVGRNGYSTSFTFIYGDNAEKYAMDGTTKCFRGGGLNPCTVDTDCDLLPDAWEYQFAGIVYENGKFKASLSDSDFATLVQSDAHQNGLDTNSVAQIRGGMDGTFKGDADYDFDHDGLLNCQEYLVQSLRHLRYDDSKTPLMGVDPGSKRFVRFLPFSAWDGNAFHKKCNESGFTGLAAWQFRELGYFALPPHSWDQIALNKAGHSNCKNYEHSEGTGYRVMLRPVIEIPLMGPKQATGYASTDPRCWDTDNDGMDDYYEIFHGLNPLLGSAADPTSRNEQGNYNFQMYDVVAGIYGGVINAWCNAWTGYGDTQPAFDAIQRPWMIGTMECDADGDGLRNDEESLKVNLAKPANSHTDPTPLWMTDSTSKRFASFTSQYYGPDPYLSETPSYNELNSYPDIFCYPWKDLNSNTRVNAPGSGGINRSWMFSFEENEGYDTDHDFKSDSVELVRKVEPTSDPLNFSDPSRRQALYLPGDASAAVSYNSESRRSIGTEPDLLKQFTVECWVYPEEAQADRVIIERVCVYGASTLSNNQTYVRANFRIGIDAEGRAYGEYEGSTVDSGCIHLTGQKLPAGKWTHLAFTYNGYTAALYMNGEMAPVASINGAGLIPANGIDGILQESGTSVLPYTGYRALPCANIVGARALTPAAVNVTPETTWEAFGSFYKGWIDEVRVWDGARTPTQIHDDYLKRYSFEQVSAQRDTVYKAWRNGATRADHDPATALPAELLLHYNFASIPGGIAEENVIKAPAGFQAAVLDNVRKTNSKDLDSALNVGWWDDLAVKSTVYDNYAIVPWIENTVAHLPLMDGSSVDSQYWNAYAAGLISAESIGKADGYSYPNSANPYSSYVYRFERVHHLNNLASAWTLSSPDGAGTISGDPRYDSYMFQLRSDFVGTSDLIPLGGAFAKRGETFWDGQGAMDAWTLTSDGSGVVDSDGDGIPDWAEKLGYTTAEKYLKALAEGLIPVQGFEVKNGAFADVADANNDGLRDWWQKLYDLKDNAKSDTDKDGLADFAEYLVGEVFDVTNVSPVIAKTDGVMLDYFIKWGDLYLGEMFADHDFMEDEWENRFAGSITSSAVYDPHTDADGDGWSNYAECRAGTLPDRTATITAEGQQVPDYPEPMISVKAFCKNAAQLSAPVVVMAYSDDSLSSADATWNIPGSEESMVYERVVGVNPGVKTRYVLGPSIVVPGSVQVYSRDPAELDVVDGRGTWMGPADAPWREIMREEPITGNNYMANISASEVVGTVEYRTGVVDIDFAALPKYRYDMLDSYTFYAPATNTYIRSNLAQSYVKITWESKRLADESKWEFALSRATAGHIREGLNTFVAFADIDGNGAYTVGEPLGIARNVDVKWNSASFEIELTYDESTRAAIGISSDAPEAVRNARLIVNRSLVNGKPSTSSGGIQNPVIIEREIGSRTYIHEGDLLKAADFDIDWSNFTRDVLNSKMVTGANMNVTSVVYRVDVSMKSASGEEVVSESHDIKRAFTTKQLVATPCNAYAVNYGARPVFRWKNSASGVSSQDWDTFTAFSILVTATNGSKAVEIWNSGVQQMPPALPSGEFEWKAPLYVNDIMANGSEFANTSNYYWQVALHNSKYQVPVSLKNITDKKVLASVPQKFRMNVYGAGENATGYGVIDACVKYFGPAANTAVVRVEAYTTPDFSGLPAGRGYTTNYEALSDTSFTDKVSLIGLEAGTYYVLAYIDSDNDGKRSNWESWGYVCPRGDIVTGSMFAPQAITVSANVKSDVVVFIEDTDIDQDTLPDVYEYDTAKKQSGDFLQEKGTPENGNNSYISINPELDSLIRNLINAGSTPSMLSAGAGMMSMNLASLALGMPTLENSVEEGTLAIKSIALDGDNVNLTVGAAADEPAKGTVFVSDGKVTVTIVVSYADALGGTWNSTELTKTFEIEDGSVADILTFSLSELGLDSSKGFFKVELK